MKRSVSYQKGLIRTLRKPEESVAYLNAAIQDGDLDVFLLALRNVIEAQGSITEIAQRSRLHRVSLHKMFAPKGNPTAKSLLSLFRVLGLRIELIPSARRRKNLRKAA